MVPSTIEFIRNCCGDFFTIHLTAIGICFTIFTLVYSFIATRKSEIEEYSEELKSKYASPQIAQRYAISKSYIRRMSLLNRKCIIAILLSASCLILSWLGYRISISQWLLLVNIIVISILSVCEFIYIIVFMHKLYIQYKQDLLN